MAYPSYSGPLKNPFNDIGNEDDEFGDFTSAVTFPSIGNGTQGAGFQVPVLDNHPVSVKLPTNSVFFNPIHDSDNDDEFGDFCGPTVAAAATAAAPTSFTTPEESVAKKCQPNYDIDLEEDLTAATQLSWASPRPVDEPLPEPVAEETEEEEFTNFTSAEPAIDMLSSDCPPPPPIVELSPAVAVPDLFSALDPSDPVLETPTLLPLGEFVDSVRLDDDFGDFTQAVTRPVEDLFSLDAVQSSDAVSEPAALVDDEEPLYFASSEVVESPRIDWDEEPLEPLQVADPLPVDDSSLAADDEEEEFVFNENVVVVEEHLAEDAQEEFGDFTDFQTACQATAVVTEEEEEEDEFDDFEAAPPLSETDESSHPVTAETAENQIQRVLMTLFPVSLPVSGQEPDPQIALSNSPGGGLWSYVSQLDSTPALSFSWRHSAAQQRFLHSLRIDSVLQGGHGGYRWSSPANTSSSTSESFTESTVTLDLDFFLNPSTTTTAAAPATSTNPTDSILETIERELLSVGSSSKNRPHSNNVQSPAPVRHSSSSSQLSDLFQHLHLDPSSPSSTTSNRQQGVVDLLQ